MATSQLFHGFLCYSCFLMVSPGLSPHGKSPLLALLPSPGWEEVHPYSLLCSVTDWQVSLLISQGVIGSKAYTTKTCVLWEFTCLLWEQPDLGLQNSASEYRAASDQTFAFDSFGVYRSLSLWECPFAIQDSEKLADWRKSFEFVLSEPPCLCAIVTVSPLLLLCGVFL